MTYGSGPPRDWQPPAEPDDETALWHRAAAGGTPAAKPRIPHPPAPARHLGAAPAASAPPGPPTPPQRPAPASGWRPNPPASAAPAAPRYFPPAPAAPVPTSPTGPRVPSPPGPRVPSPPGPRAPASPGWQPSPPGPYGRRAVPPPAPPAMPQPRPGRRTVVPPAPGPGRPGPVPRQPGPGRTLRPPAPSARPRSARLVSAVPGLIRHLPQHRPWMVALGLIATVVIMTTCGLGSYLLVKDDSSVVGAVPTPSRSVALRDISSRVRDPRPLTIADVFPTAEFSVDPAVPPYRRMGDPQAHKDCRVAATADLGKLLVSLGCSQVIRATFASPDTAYLITAGIFNLKDNAGAERANERIAELVDAGKGRLSGYISTSATRILGRAPTQLAWDVHGHFLVYSVIARVNGKAFDDGDQNLPVMRYDMVEKYLRDVVIAKWSIDHSTPEASAGSSPPAPPT